MHTLCSDRSQHIKTVPEVLGRRVLVTVFDGNKLNFMLKCLFLPLLR